MIKKGLVGLSLVVQWLRNQLAKKKKNPPYEAGDPGSMPQSE